MIPKILHFIWIGKPMPDWARKNIDEFRMLNPEFRIMIHGKEILYESYRGAYESIPDLCAKSDLLRLSAMRELGGWYFDCDFWPLRPIREIVNDYDLKDKPFITKQFWHKRKSLVYANGILALPAAPSSVWNLIDNAIIETYESQKVERVSFGPKMFTEIIYKNPNMFDVGDWPWFYPTAAHPSRVIVNKLINGELDKNKLTGLTPESHGQLPFVIHLFADGATDIFSKLDFSGLHAGVFCGTKLNDTSITRNTMHAIAQGLTELGITVEVVPSWEAIKKHPDMIFIWNGRKGICVELTKMAKSRGCIVFNSEHGFFNRSVYTQLDHEGILHWTSWRNDLHKPAPAEGEARLKEVWKFPYEGFGKRDSKRILVLGQLNGDSQMMESEIQASKQIAQLVKDNLPQGYKAFFRPHPKANGHHTHKALRYLPLETSDTLLGAVLKSKFAVTINSNAGNECLGLGCPVLAFGPALYLQARVGLSCNPRNIKKRLQEMADGWMPDSDDVKNYLNHLACRQWSFDELKQGKFLKPLIEAAQCPSILL